MHSIVFGVGITPKMILVFVVPWLLLDFFLGDRGVLKEQSGLAR